MMYDEAETQVALRSSRTSTGRRASSGATVLGAAPTARFEPPGLLFFDLGGTRLLLDAAAPSAMVYVEVPDVHAALERIAHRATVVAEPHAIFTHEDGALGPEGTTEWQAFVSDPDGNTVGW